MAAESMIERVARRLCMVNGMDPDSKSHLDGNEFLWQDYVKDALAAIDEMMSIDAWVPAVVSMNWTLSADQVERLYQQVLETALRGRP